MQACSPVETEAHLLWLLIMRALLEMALSFSCSDCFVHKHACVCNLPVTWQKEFWTATFCGCIAHFGSQRRCLRRRWMPREKACQAIAALMCRYNYCWQDCAGSNSAADSCQFR